MSLDAAENGTVWNPYGWNDRVNVLFLGQLQAVYVFLTLTSADLLGTGFSYADFDEMIEKTEDAGKDVQALFQRTRFPYGSLRRIA
ncbi:uncharacterized protein EI90DRAFT_3037740 [Cantharellus anzutake]|uniref:uncharacterized protein n=1 Tax=Cantharellus anzutake TaxID=1750568 RepID=UPI0019074749|nr:uncharacterized protein EI90DRAFT_3037740 [Cantharellus anzutake]KAF8339783.1 hypothetical protein EI90DRAFT_3037740 [Cantharellus anzutake]